MVSGSWHEPVRARRLELGLTQLELARAAGVSRQLVAAVEGGRHAPAVDAALRLAAALATTVETLFGPPDAPALALALAAPPADGTPLRLGRVGDRLVAAPLADHGIIGAGWAAPDAVWRRGRAERLPGARTSDFVVAGCEPALTLAQELLSPHRLMAVSASTGTALEALANGSIHAAVVHGIQGDLPAPPVPVTRHHLARWRVVVAASRALGIESLDDLFLSQTPVAQREAAATTQQALARAADRCGAQLPAGPQASGHIEAARFAELGGGAGVTTEPAATAFSVPFLPLEEHVVELWTDARWAGHPGQVALVELLNSRAFTARLAARGGYDLTACGSAL